MELRGKDAKVASVTDIKLTQFSVPFSQAPDENIVAELKMQMDILSDGLNNSHIIIFDIHSEHRTAFPNANCLDVSNIILPYWLLNSEELQELFLDTEANDHNQRNVFILECKNIEQACSGIGFYNSLIIQHQI